MRDGITVPTDLSNNFDSFFVEAGILRQTQRPRTNVAFRLKGFFFGVAALIAFGLHASEPPSNNHFTNRIRLSGVPVLTHGSNLSATREPGDPVTVGGVVCNATVWWSWTAPSSGRYAAIIMMPAPTLPALDVYTGSIATGLVQAAEFSTRDAYQTIRQGTNCNAFQVLFDATAGTEYEILAGAEFPAEGPFELAIARPPNIGFIHSANGADFSPGTNIPLEVAVSSSNGTIISVEYSIRFGQTLARATAAPWNGVWTNAPVGRHQLVARTVDDFGATTVTNIEITVGRPLNDDFENRIALSGLPVIANGNILAAGKEPGERETIGYYTSRKTIWWSWTAPSNGTYAVLATATNPVLVGVYTGPSVDSLFLEAFTAGTHAAVIGGQYRFCSQAALHANGGTTYHIVVDDAGTSVFDVGLAITVPPRVTLASPTNGSVFANGEPIPLLADAHDADGTIQQVEFLEIHTIPGSGWSVPLGTVTNAPWSGVANSASTGSYPVMARATDNFGAQSVSTNRIWMGVSRPVNDDFAQRITIANTRTNITVFGLNEWASAETGETYGRRSVWWSWTAPASGPTIIDTCGSTFNADLRRYTGSAISNLVLRGSVSASPCTTMHFNAVAGTTYHIAIDGGVGGSSGVIALNLLAPPPPSVRFIIPGRVVNGEFQSSFEGVPGQSSIVEASSNLIHWVPLATNNFSEGSIPLRESGVTNSSQRFYRVRQE